MPKKLIIILGPTASGKSKLAIKLAKKFNGEVISADSRQVYKGMDIGSGKVTKKEMRGIPHYLLDVVSPKTRFTVAKYQKLAKAAIKKIHKKGKIPFLVGGTGFYIQSVIDGIVIPKVKPDWKLRKKLEKKTASELFETLKKLDPRRAKNIDKHNKRRLIRAIEIVKKLGTVPPLSLPCPQYCILMIGVKRKPGELKKLIKKRLMERLKKGMISEIRKLKKSGLSWKRLEEFGLEYRYIAQYLQKKINYQEMIEKIQKESEHYAKRQMTWFSRHWSGSSMPILSSILDRVGIKSGKKDKRIHWIENYRKTERIVKEFLKNKGRI